MPAKPPPVPEPPATRELWSHEFLDALALEQFRQVANRIRQNPDLIEHARNNIHRWLAKTDYHPGEIRSLMEWDTLLQPGRLPQLLAGMTDTDEDAVRMRQSSPFAGILTETEREQVIDRVTNEWMCHEPG